MASILSRLFTQKDLDRISAAIAGAESKTSGEVVPFVVAQSDHYDEADLRAALSGGILPLLLLVTARKLTDLWIPFDALEVTMLVLAGMAAGWALSTFLPPVKRLFAGRRLIERRVAQRAAEAFVSEEVFATRDRTGILLFISILERRVLVLGDNGISAHVGKADWEAVVRLVTDGIRNDRPAEGLIAGLERCGALLQQHGVARKGDDTNELSDRLRTGK
jgi:putative membrane protein